MRQEPSRGVCARTPQHHHGIIEPRAGVSRLDGVGDRQCLCSRLALQFPDDVWCRLLRIAHGLHSGASRHVGCGYGSRGATMHSFWGIQSSNWGRAARRERPGRLAMRCFLAGAVFSGFAALIIAIRVKARQSQAN